MSSRIQPSANSSGPKESKLQSSQPQSVQSGLAGTAAWRREFPASKTTLFPSLVCEKQSMIKMQAVVSMGNSKKRGAKGKGVYQPKVVMQTAVKWERCRGEGKSNETERGKSRTGMPSVLLKLKVCV